MADKTTKAGQKAATETNEVAVVTTQDFKAPTTQAEIPDTIEYLKKKLSELKGGEDKRVSLDVTYNGEKVSEITSITSLMEINGAIQWRAKIHEEGLDQFNLRGKVKPFTVDGHTPDHWGKVIAKAINEKMNQKQIVEIETAIKKLSSHLDEQTKLQQTLKDISESVLQPLD